MATILDAPGGEATDNYGCIFYTVQGGVDKYIDIDVLVPPSVPVDPSTQTDVFGNSQPDRLIDLDFIRDCYTPVSVTSSDNEYVWVPADTKFTLAVEVDGYLDINVILDPTNMPATVIVPLWIWVRRINAGSGDITISYGATDALSYYRPVLPAGEDALISFPVVWHGPMGIFLMGAGADGVELAGA
jgi:hypothetical protein